MSTDRSGELSEKQGATILKKLLGSLELEIIEWMWQAGEGTVRQVAEAINRTRPIAYTTVMTVMGHLVDKGLLARTKDGRRYRYRVTRSRDDFLLETSKNMTRTLVDDFGDLAIAGFLGEITKVDADRLEQLKKLVQAADSENNIFG